MERVGKSRGFLRPFPLFFLFVLLIFGIFQYSIHKIFGMVYYPDEFGYWASAANWVGYDWSSLTALNSYYSFGYSILLAPILKVCSDAVTAYRTAVALNMLLHVAAMPMLYGILRRLFPEASDTARICAAGVALFYPVWDFYEQTTLAEGLLFFLYIAVVYLTADTVSRVRLGTILPLAGCLVYICLVHMRTIGVVAAAVFLLFIRLWKEPAYRKKLLVVFCTLAFGAVLGVMLRFTVLRSVYGNTDQEMLATNDITGQFARVMAVCTGEGLLRFFCGCAGKIFYMGAASFGLVYYALAYLCRMGVRFMRKIRGRSRISAQEWLSLFLLLSFAGQFLITAVYMNNSRRVDEVVYGRYNDYLVPVFMGIGVMVLYRCRSFGRYISTALALQSAMLPVVLYGEKMYGGNEIQGYFMAGISYLVKDLQFDVIPDMAGIFLLGNLMTLLFSLCIWIGREKKLSVSAMALMVCVEIVLAIGLHHKYTYRFNELVEAEVRLAGQIAREDADTPITYLYGSDITYIDIIQFQLPERKITVMLEEETEGIRIAGGYPVVDRRDGGAAKLSGYVLLDADSVYREQMDSYRRPCAESAYFALYDWREFP